MNLDPTSIDDMSKTIHIGSTSQFDDLLKSTKILVADCMLPTQRPTMFHPPILLTDWESMPTGADRARLSVRITSSYPLNCLDLKRSPSPRSTPSSNRRLLGDMALRRRILPPLCGRKR